MSLRERDIALRKAAAEVEAIEIANEKAKLALKIDQIYLQCASADSKNVFDWLLNKE